MTETVPAPEDAASARATEQARLRKERREAKIRAGGASRLDKITGLGGGVKRDLQPQPPSQTSTPPPQATASVKNHHDDPEEVDISQHYYAPQSATRPPPPEPSISDAQLRQMMLGFDRHPPGVGAGASTPPQNPFFDGMPPGMEGMENDPMMKMMQQMMGGAGGGGGNPFAGTGMEGLFGGAGGGGMQAAAVTDKSVNTWRIIHAVFALGLGLYVALSTTFTGTKTERDFSSLATSKDSGAGVDSDAAAAYDNSIEQTRAYFFYLFTSVEAVLLTTRYFLDKHRAPPSGIVWTVSGFLPDRLRSGVRHALRYGQIFSTVRSDALVCVFVLGVCCWLRS
ncbi:hypothetical protein BJ170DRAFT_728725 [Xylariales sp. AK1849]|nr:hypothetical protein BJ170DRAFT_728725 [Xylariales sp. AK1849]